jgi:hypothetical protein
LTYWTIAALVTLIEARDVPAVLPSNLEQEVLVVRVRWWAAVAEVGGRLDLHAGRRCEEGQKDQ